VQAQDVRAKEKAEATVAAPAMRPALPLAVLPGTTDAKAARVGGPPTVMLVGSLAGLRPRAVGAAGVVVSRPRPEDVPGLLEGAPPDVVLLDSSLPSPLLAPILLALGPAHSPTLAGGAAPRPAVLVFIPPGRPSRLERRLREHADDFVSGGLGEEAVLVRLRGALRVRGFVGELSRKNEELQGLYHRLEGMARRMADELRLASNVQRSLLPAPVQHSRLEMAREFIPFREIGGDYYDFIELGPERLAVAIGDVMGKGVPAALMAANLKASVRAQVQGGDTAPEDLTRRVNRLFWDVTPQGLFCSLFFAVFDLERGVLEYVNAGHHYPFLVRRDGTILDLVEGGTVVGLAEDSRYRRGETRLEPDDLVVLYSDGVTDRGNAGGELFGVERLKEAALRNRAAPARIVLYSLLGDVQGWSAGTPADDDATLIVAKHAGVPIPRSGSHSGREPERLV
jgi:serine phosphatase RsbU (regulator of sigma subunit)